MAAWLALIDPISRLIDKLIPDPQAAANAKLELMKAENAQALEELRLAVQVDTAQIEVNKVEAASSSIFVAGWRPWIGWVCGMAFAFHFVILPFLIFMVSCYRGECAAPDFDMDTLNTVLMGMLGLGSLRTIEKVRGK